MLKALVNDLYGSVPVSIHVNGSPEQAARRLGAKTRRWAGFTFLDKVVGSVAVDRVILRVSRRLFRNGFAPIFRGRFTLVHSKTHLVGSFSLSRPAQVFATIWFAFIGAYCAIAVIVGAKTSSMSGAPLWLGIAHGLLFALGGLGLGVLGCIGLRFAKRLSEPDLKKIIEHVKSTVAKNAV
jgi:hypothetical protein